MSYSNGIGSAQLLLAAVSTASATAASRVQTEDASAGISTVAKAGDGEDRTTFSSAASLIAQPASDSDVRTEKVAALQQAIAAGTYSVSASDVADKLIKVMTN